jgi:hypothetical protein
MRSASAHFKGDGLDECSNKSSHPHTIGETFFYSRDHGVPSDWASRCVKLFSCAGIRMFTTNNTNNKEIVLLPGYDDESSVKRKSLDNLQDIRMPCLC